MRRITTRLLRHPLSRTITFRHLFVTLYAWPLSGGVEPFDEMIELDMEVHHHESTLPIAALSTMADALPGLGIVAAVLGVVITMGALAARRKRSESMSQPRSSAPFWAF